MIETIRYSWWLVSSASFDAHLKVIVNGGGRVRIVERLEKVDAAILELQRLFGAVVQRVDDRAEVLFALDHARVLTAGECVSVRVPDKEWEIEQNQHA